MNTQTNNDDGLTPSQAASLREGLQGLYGEALAVPPDLDAAILARARLRLQGRPHRRLFPWVAAGAAAAAAVLLVVWTAAPHRRPPVERTAAPAPVAASPRGDYDRDGRVNILDAFALARRIESGGAADRAWDLNGDGAVDRLDVDSIAVAAVRIDGGRAW
jgi:hypothetical protein